MGDGWENGCQRKRNEKGRRKEEEEEEEEVIKINTLLPSTRANLVPCCCMVVELLCRVCATREGGLWSVSQRPRRVNIRELSEKRKMKM